MSSFLIAQITSTKNWTRISVEDGLIDNEVIAIKAEDDQNLWIGTPKGLSHYDGNTITNYTSVNSGLNDDNILRLELAHDKLWLQTDSGISSFDGISFVNYTSNNGLLNSRINDLTVTPDDTLWIGTNNGVSNFDGNTFIHDSTKIAAQIESDSLGRIYIMYSGISGRLRGTFIEILDSGKWIEYLPPNDIDALNTLKRTSSGELIYMIDDGYGVISYPISTTKKKLYYGGTESFFGIVAPKEIEIDGNKLWTDIVSSGAAISSTKDSILFPYSMNYDQSSIDASYRWTRISIYDETIFVGTQKGVYYVNKNIENDQDKYELMDVNSIKTYVSSVTSPLSERYSHYNFEFPKGSGSHGIFASSFVLVAKQFNNSDYQISGISPFNIAYSPGPINNTDGLNDSYIFKVKQSEIETHKTDHNKAGYTPPKGIADWPAAGDTSLGMTKTLAPFVDVNNDSCYNPADGDYPLIKGDEAIYWINHPLEKDSGRTLKFEYHWMLYAYDEPTDSTLNQTLFLQHTIVNRAEVDYDSIKLGVYFDTDLGNPSDDYVGCDSLSNIAYTYNGDSNDEDFRENKGYGTNPPAFGMKFLTDTMDLFIYYNIGTANNGDPSNKTDWLNYLNARWKNGDEVKYGGNGYNSGTTSTSTKYMFTGNPGLDIGWTEETPGNGLLPHSPGDRRSLSSIPYFSLAVGERKTVELVLGYDEINKVQTAVGETVPELINLLNNAKEHWDTIAVSSSTYASKISCRITSLQEFENKKENSISMYPIPAKDAVKIQSEEKIKRVELYDLKGAQLNSVEVSSTQFELDLSNNQNGFYFVRVQLQDNSWVNGKIIVNR